jgi:hypothetical protein
MSIQWPRQISRELFTAKMCVLWCRTCDIWCQGREGIIVLCNRCVWNKTFTWALVLLRPMWDCICADFEPKKRSLHSFTNSLYDQQPERCSEDPPGQMAYEIQGNTQGSFDMLIGVWGPSYCSGKRFLQPETGLNKCYEYFLNKTCFLWDVLQILLCETFGCDKKNSKERFRHFGQNMKWIDSF